MKNLKAFQRAPFTSSTHPTARRPSSSQKKPSSIQAASSIDLGFSLAYALLIGLGIFVLAGALSSRTFYGVLTSVFNQDTRRARDSAELGATRIISELNREPNRMYLAVAPTGSDGFWSSTQSDNPFRNPCAINAKPTARSTTIDLANVRTGGASSTTPSNASRVVYIRTDGSIQASSDASPASSVTNNVVGAYLLNRVDLPSTASWPSNSNSPQRGQIRLSVRGYSYNQGKLSGSTTIEQTYEVVPKCCNISLGGNNNSQIGNDQRNCNAQINDPSFGFIFGTSPILDSTVSLTGTACSETRTTNCAAIDEVGTTSPVNPLICLSTLDSTGVSSGCPSSVNVGSSNPVPVSALPTTLAQPERFKPFLSNGNVPSSGNININASSFNDLDTCATSPSSFLCSIPQSGNQPNIVVLNAASTTIPTTTTSEPANLPSSWPRYCGIVRNDAFTERVVDSSGNTTQIPRSFESIHCNINTLSVTNGYTLRIVTSNSRRVVLHFPAIDNGTTKTIDVNGSIEHCNFSSSAPYTCNSAVAGQSDANPLLRLHILGCPYTLTGSGASTRASCTVFANDSSTARNSNACATSVPGISNTVNCQTVRLTGNSTVGQVPYFLYFPLGYVDINGGGSAGDQLRGMIWANSLTGSGNVKISVPGSGIGDILDLYSDMTNPGVGGTGIKAPLFFEFIARAVRGFRLLPGN